MIKAIMAIDNHGGVIEFDSDPGKTVFRVILPMYAGSNEEDEIKG